LYIVLHIFHIKFKKEKNILSIFQLLQVHNLKTNSTKYLTSLHFKFKIE